MQHAPITNPLSALRQLTVRMPGFDKLSPRSQDLLKYGSKAVDKADALMRRAEQRSAGRLCFTCADPEFATAKLTTLVTADPAVTEAMLRRGHAINRALVQDPRITGALAKLAEAAGRAARKASAA